MRRAAGFTAARITGNLLDPRPRPRQRYDGVWHAAIWARGDMGTVVGAGGAPRAFFGLTLATGTLVVMGSAGVGTVVGDLANGRDWDEHLLANVIILGVFHSIPKVASDRIPSRRTTLDPTGTRDPGQTESHRSPAPGAVAEIVIDNPGRLRRPTTSSMVTSWAPASMNRPVCNTVKRKSRPTPTADPRAGRG